MFLDLKDLNVDQLQEKSNQLYRKLNQLYQFPNNNHIMIEQCKTWINQIALEIEEKLTPVEESGVVTIIGEDSKEANELIERNKKNG